MRIISGKFKGRRFNTKIPPNVRPTQDSMRETIFNIISNYIDFSGLVVADLCSGTGALGLEALSRGAEFAYFVDSAKQSLDYTRKIAQELSLTKDDYMLSLGKAESFFAKYGGEKNIDVIFTDPPYALNIINKLLEQAARSEFFPAGGYFIAEFSSLTNLILPPNFEIRAERVFSSSRFAIFEKTE